MRKSKPKPLIDETDLPPKPSQAATYFVKHMQCCLFCGGDDIVAGNLSFVGADEVGQHVQCNQCDREWFDVYKFRGVSNSNPVMSWTVTPNGPPGTKGPAYHV